MTLSARGYAKLRGVSHTAVQKAIKSGRISVESDGKINPDIADKEWARNTRTSLPSQPSYRVAEDISQNSGHNSTLSDFNRARAVRETYKARLAKLEYEELSGKLVNADEVKVAAFNASRRVRDRILQIPRRISAQLAAETEAYNVESLLNSALREALEELSGESHE